MRQQHVRGAAQARVGACIAARVDQRVLQRGAHLLAVGGVRRRVGGCLVLGCVGVAGDRVQVDVVQQRVVGAADGLVELRDLPRLVVLDHVFGVLEACRVGGQRHRLRSEEHTSELQSPCNLVCRLLLEKKKKQKNTFIINKKKKNKQKQNK